MVSKRLSADWQVRFGSPLVGLETFVDPEYFQGTCYQASGWQRLGETAGYARSRKDFYQEHNRPKELWFKALDRGRHYPLVQGISRVIFRSSGRDPGSLTRAINDLAGQLPDPLICIGPETNLIEDLFLR